MVNNYGGNGWDFRTSEFSTTNFRPLLTVNYDTIASTDTGVFAFARSAFNVNEGNSGTPTTAITVYREDGTAESASVNYSVTGGSATGTSTDYTLASGTTAFASMPVRRRGLPTRRRPSATVGLGSLIH